MGGKGQPAYLVATREYLEPLLKLGGLLGLLGHQLPVGLQSLLQRVKPVLGAGGGAQTHTRWNVTRVSN